MSYLDDLRRDVSALLDAYLVAYSNEREDVARFHALLDTVADPFVATEARGHITASTVVVTPEADAVLLLFHQKLGRWLQPGGHVETDLDASIHAAARRELREETGLDPDRAEPQLLDIDIHPIPARPEMPAHEHYDLRILFRHPTVSFESSSIRWLPLSEVERDREPSLARFARKIRVGLDR